MERELPYLVELASVVATMVTAALVLRATTPDLHGGARLGLAIGAALAVLWVLRFVAARREEKSLQRQ